MQNIDQLSLFPDQNFNTKFPKNKTKNKVRVKSNSKQTTNKLNIDADKIELRDYQIELKDKALENCKYGLNSLVYAPTGAGKTVVFSKIVSEYLNAGKRVLILINREFLIDQIIESLSKFKIKCKVGYIKAKYKEDRNARLQIGSIQTFLRRKLFLPTDLIIIDECHTTCFYKAYEAINDHYGCPKIGFSASPFLPRKKQIRLLEYFPNIVKLPSSSVRKLMAKNYLCKARYFGFGGHIDPSELKVENGEYAIGHMQNKFIAAEIPELITEHLKSHPMFVNKTGIIFNSGVRQSLLQTDLLNKAGIDCVHIDGNTPHDERRKLFDKLERKDIQYISSVNTITEGLDVRSIENIVLARSTLSLCLYIQMIGRGLRIAEGKSICNVIDYGGNVTNPKFGYITKDFPIKPSDKEPEPPQMKECPECHTMLYNFVKICPECGHLFGYESNEYEAPFLPDFGEILDARSKKLINFIRDARRKLYNNNRPPNIAVERFYEVYPDDYFFPKWLKGSVFEYGSYENKIAYLGYLKQFGKDEKWVKYYFDLEFGKYEPLLINGETWFEILETSENSTIEAINSKYKELVASYNLTDTENETEARQKIDIINKAYDEALRYSARFSFRYD